MIRLRGKVLSWLGLACIFGLAACSKGNENIVQRSLDLVLDGILTETQDPQPRRTITRAELNNIPFATISLARKPNDDLITFIVAVANNNGYVTYQETAGRSVVLRGNMLTSTNGLGLDLAAIKHQPGDPVTIKTPVSEWSTVAARNYQFSASGRPNYEITVICTREVLARERIEVVELFFDVTRVVETCRNPKREFVNTYWVGDDGQIWKSEQWAGPELGTFVLQTIRPFG